MRSYFEVSSIVITMRKSFVIGPLKINENVYKQLYTHYCWLAVKCGNKNTSSKDVFV